MSDCRTFADWSVDELLVGVRKEQARIVRLEKRKLRLEKYLTAAHWRLGKMLEALSHALTAQ